MKSLIIFHSTYHHNTERIARVCASKLNADLIGLKDAHEVKIEDYDLIGFGSGVYKECMSAQLLNYAEKSNVKGKDFFVFSTSGVGMRFYNNELVTLLKKKGARCMGSFACKGSFVSRDFSKKKVFEYMSKFADGHPDDKDLLKAGKFIEKIVEQYKA